jgi:predicted DNA-binding antitoxin AbrB/MazE fold protein
MTVQPIRAIHKDGYLKLLDPVALAEDQELAVIIMDSSALIKAALGDLLLSFDPISPEDEIDEAALLAEIQQAFAGQAPLSEAILEERRTGP